VNCLYADPLGTAGHRYQLHVATASQRGMRQNRPLSEIDGGFACGAGARARREQPAPHGVYLPVCPSSPRVRCARPCIPCVSRVLEVTQTHIHIHTHTFTPWRVPRGGGLEGRVCPGSPRCLFTGTGTCFEALFGSEFSYHRVALVLDVWAKVLKNVDEH